ncbi:MAG: hypothetical protein H0U66_06645 [Gemmatimonadaceae bacterium]|nr:hypothetical protein [Gemmatimonadaceae bacterium]
MITPIEIATRIAAKGNLRYDPATREWDARYDATCPWRRLEYPDHDILLLMRELAHEVGVTTPAARYLCSWRAFTPTRTKLRTLCAFVPSSDGADREG